MYYKNLSIMFSSMLYWFATLRTLESETDKAICSIKFINRECNGFSVQLLFYLFDKLVLPITFYGWKIWGYTVRNEIEKFTNSFINVFYVFHLNHFLLRCLENVGVCHCQFIIFLEVSFSNR